MKSRLRGLTVEEIRHRFLEKQDQSVDPRLMRALRSDPRQGVRQVFRSLERREEVERRERVRIRRILRWEKTLWANGLERVAGVDEVGVGPLAGPVVAAAVVFPPGTEIDGINDSKEIDEEKRIRLAAQIHNLATAVGIGLADVQEIDRLNIYHAALRAMRRAIEHLNPQPQFVLTDSRRVPHIRVPQRPVPKGDARCFAVAAASIIAKTHRDHLMKLLDSSYPGYGFASHKGYSTQAHFQAIRNLGPCPLHRRSFNVIAELNGECCPLFYSLMERVEAAETLEEASGLLRRFRNASDRLAPGELQRLRMILARRRKRLESAQMALF